MSPNDTTLTLAVSEDRPALIELLIMRGADPNRTIADGPITENMYSPLARAVSCGHAQCVRALLAASADPQLGWGKYPNTTPLFDAADCGHLEIVRLLLAAGADPFAVGYKNYLPFGRAAYRGRFDIMQVLYDAMRLSERFREGLGLCMRSAVYDELVEVVRWVLERHPELYDEPYAPGGEYPIYGAALRGNVEMIELLTSFGPVHFDSGQGNRTALHLAALKGGLAAVQALVAAGADVNAREAGSGFTPIFYASYHDDPYREHTAIAAYLCEQGADPNVRSEEGRTPLMMAVREGMYGVIEALLRHEPDLSLRDPEGRDVYDLATARGDRQIIELVLRG